MNELSQNLKITNTVVVIFSFLSCLFSSTLIHERIEWAFVYQARVLKSQKVKQFGKYHHFCVYFYVCFLVFFFFFLMFLSYTKHKSIAVIVRKTLKTLRENICMWIGKKKKRKKVIWWVSGKCLCFFLYFGTINLRATQYTVCTWLKLKEPHNCS